MTSRDHAEVHWWERLFWAGLFVLSVIVGTCGMVITYSAGFDDGVAYQIVTEALQ